MRRFYKSICLSLIQLLFLGFGIGQAEFETPYKYKVPKQINDGWQTGHLKDVNLNESELNNLIAKIKDKTYTNIHSVLVVRDGKLVFEEYFAGSDFGASHVKYTSADLHQAMSVTKSVTSTIVGIAIDKGLIKSAEENIVSFFPEYKPLFKDGREKIKLKHLLAMTAGFDWDETSVLYNDPRNPYLAMFGEKDIINHIIGYSIKGPPGEQFNYNSGLSLLLGAIIEKRSPLGFREYAKEHLFDPLGITSFKWGYWANWIPKSDTGLCLRPRDMAKIGYLFANNGKWQGKQIVSEQWIKEATKEHAHINPERITGYGYQWWKYDFEGKEAIVAIGYGGQNIFVLPKLDLVVVFTAGNFSEPHSKVLKMTYHMVNEYIIGGLQ